jgi:hypothetical protein
MARGSINRLTTGVTNATPALEIIAGPDRGFWLREVFLTLAAATASVYGLGRPAAKGTTPTSPKRFLNELDALAAANSQITAATALAWGGAPTIPADFYRQASLPAAIGASVWWTFDRGLDKGGIFVAPGATLVIWNGAAAPNSAAYIDIVIDEDVRGL